jgi:hypothetical protein
MATTVESRRYIDSVLDFTTSELAFKFGVDMDIRAAAQPERFSHVYEWGEDYYDKSTVGNPFYRLWRLGTVGEGNTRTLGFFFQPSERPSPIHPQLLEPGAKERTVNEGVHVFVWKAPIMEYGLTVIIRPELAKKLVFVDDKTGKTIFTSRTITARPGVGRNGENHVGQFTRFFREWWGGRAEQEFDRTVRPRIESDLGDLDGLSTVLSKYRPRTKQVNIEFNNTTAFNDGESQAKRDYSRSRQDFLAAAARRRMDIYGY